MRYFASGRSSYMEKTPPPPSAPFQATAKQTAAAANPARHAQIDPRRISTPTPATA